MKNWVKADTVSACCALSVAALIASYFVMWASTVLTLDCRVARFFSTCARFLSTERQNGMKLSRILCRVSYDLRYSLIALSWIVVTERLISSSTRRTSSLPADLTLATAATASVQSGGGGGTSPHFL